MSGITRKGRRIQVSTGNPLLRSSGGSLGLPVRGEEFKFLRVARCSGAPAEVLFTRKGKRIQVFTGSPLLRSSGGSPFYP